MLAKRQLAEFVCDAVNLEGIKLTLPEIQTLLDGITVGGHKLADQQIALNQADTWRAIFGLIDKNQFEITCEKVCALHLIALPAKRQLEFNQLMLDFYETGNQKPMNTFLRSCFGLTQFISDSGLSMSKPNSRGFSPMTAAEKIRNT